MRLRLFGAAAPNPPVAHPPAASPTPAFVDALSLSPDACLLLADDGRVAWCNRAAAALVDADEERLTGKSFRSLIARADRDAFDARLATTRDSPQRFDVRVPFRERGFGGDVEGTGDSGGDRVLALAIAPARPPYAFMVTAREVTTERSALSQLARSESRYRHLFEAASYAIMTFDALGRFTTVNGAAEEISGYSREELIGKFFGPLLATEAVPRALLEFRRALGGATGQFDTIMRHKNGERRHLTVNYGCPQRSREVICMIRDATAEQNLREQLMQAEKMAAIGQLVSGVAHELNNPLATISAFAQLLLADARLDPEQRHSAEIMRSEAHRASRIISNLLTFARQRKAEKIAADINTVVHDTLELRRYELNVRGIQVVHDFDCGVPPVTMVDVQQLQQVILNLITNAEHAMADVPRPSHRLMVRTRTLPAHIRIDVEDTGCGIAESAMNQLFNPFFTTKPVGKGTGLGLSISLGIVAEHGGRIWAENVAAGGGACFSVELPRVACSAGVGTVTSVEETREAAASLRILVADDEEPLRDALARFLTSEGHAVVTVGSGSEAIWRAEGEEEFDVLLLDLRMPDVSGQVVFERWRREHRELVDRVVFITGDTVSPDLQVFLRGTGRPYLAKPFEFAAVTELLPRRRVA